MNLPVRELDEAERGHAARAGGTALGGGRAAGIKFTYPSGSRPLEGYTIKRGVGRGGFGEVYFATSDAGKEVALKLIRRNLEVELRGVTQCLNLKHPNLVGLFDIRTDEMGDQWVIMEYVSGESLEDVIERHPNGMPLEDALWWMRGMCGGVAYLHDHGIVHRDLKPGNIFFDEGTVKIGDYGLAKFISCSRRSGQTESVGTVHYMAPEIANGRYGREIDTYALGIILFEMLTGRVPFEGESVGEVLMKHLTAEPDLSALDEPYRDIVRRALAKDPTVRVNSVGEILALLPGGSQAAPPPPYPPAGRAADAVLARDVRSADAAIMRDIRNADAAIMRDIRNADAAASAQFGRGPDRRSASASETIEEPIWKAIRDGATRLRQHWHGDQVAPLHPLAKAVIVFVLVIVAINFFEISLELVFPVLLCYGVYYVVWLSFLRPSIKRQMGAARATLAGGADPGAAASGDAASAAGLDANTAPNNQTILWPAPSSAPAPAKPVSRKEAKAARRRRPNWRDAARRELAGKPLREKVSELMGSMMLAALVSAVAAFIGPMLLGSQPPSDRWAMHLWLMTIGTLGSWAILIPGKFAEARLEDQVPIRITLLAFGALVGIAGWFVGDTLFLKSPGWDEPLDANWGLVSHEMLRWTTARPGEGFAPTLAMYMSFFAFLFLVPRWWRQAEYTREKRISFWWVAVCVFWAWVVHLFWWFPQPTGMMVAGVIATATQLASPWMPPSRRRALSEQMDRDLEHAV
ncbi:MAG TPA: serine/threonine-protein kinase, partial [Lacipirellulaceae bacterium]